MGYTRYYEVLGKLDDTKFRDYSKDCNYICDIITQIHGDGLAGYDGNNDPVFTEVEIRFNGVGDNAHETFSLKPTSTGFNFTKTNMKPYDRHVLACLLLAKEYFGSNIRVSSDGDCDYDSEIIGLIKMLRLDSKIKSILT